jgi:hypothetical protein
LAQQQPPIQLLQLAGTAATNPAIPLGTGNFPATPIAPWRNSSDQSGYYAGGATATTNPAIPLGTAATNPAIPPEAQQQPPIQLFR